MQRLRELTEAECYFRCYGWVGEEGEVRIVDTPPPARAADPDRTPEGPRRGNEGRLELPAHKAA